MAKYRRRSAPVESRPKRLSSRGRWCLILGGYLYLVWVAVRSVVNSQDVTVNCADTLGSEPESLNLIH
jgi:uncharacterized integral membrane protein